MNDQAIMVVSFGTSYRSSRETAIGAIERAVAEAFPDFVQYRAFTSRMIIRKVNEQDGIKIDSVEEALRRAAGDGIKTLVVQPTHMMNGLEYRDLVRCLEADKDKFSRIVLAKPLLTDDKDYQELMQAVTESTSAYNDGETAVCFMGHGTEADANAVYAKFQNKLLENGFSHYFIGTVEADPTLETVIAAMKKAGDYRRVVLEPLMVTAGDHAHKDMAGDAEDSWKNILESEGYQVECILKGLGEFPAVQKMYITHIRDAMEGM